MNSFNRGEWSELYGVLFLLVKPNLNVVNSHLETINDTIYVLRKVILDSRIKLEYAIDSNTNNIFVYADGNEIKNYTRDEIDFERRKLLNSIISHSERTGAFSIPNSEKFVTEITSNISFKSKSSNKSDVATLVFDNIKNSEYILSYSIKSLLGSPATILNASNNTNFKYRIENFSKEKMDEVNSITTRTKLLDRIRKIKSYNNTKITFDSIVSDNLEYNLKMVDSLLPLYLGRTLLYSYEYDNKNLKQIFSLANKGLDEKFANKKLGDFLSAISFGFVPGQKWNGVNTVNGGLIVIKNNGDVVVLDLMYYPEEVNKYLINESKLDSPSTHRYHMLEIFEENGEFYFTLNLQVRYK